MAGNEFAVQIVVDALNRAQPGLKSTNKTLNSIATTITKVSQAVTSTDGEFQTMGARAQEAFTGALSGAQDATGAIDAFGQKVMTAVTGMTSASSAADTLASSTGNLGGAATGAADAQTQLTSATSASSDAALMGAGAMASHGSAMDSAASSASGLSVMLGSAGNALSKIGEFTIGAGIGAAIDGLKTLGQQQMYVNKLVTTGGMKGRTYSAALKDIQKMSGKVATSSLTLAGAMYYASSAGFNKASEATRIVTATAKAAVQEHATLIVTTRGVVSAMKAYGVQAKTVTRVTNQMIRATSHGMMQFETMAAALPTIAINAKAIGVSLPQLMGGISTLTAQGVNPLEASQLENAFFSVMSNPSQQQDQMMNQLGLNPTKLMQNMKRKGLTSVVTTINKAVTSHMTKKSGLVVLTTLRKAATAHKDLAQAMSKATGVVRQLGDALISGHDNLNTYNQSIQGLLPQQQTMAQTIGNLYQKTLGYNNLLQSGGPAMRTYYGELVQLLGRTDAARFVEASAAHMKNMQKTIRTIEHAHRHGVQGWGRTKKLMDIQAENIYHHIHTQVLPNAVGGLEKFGVKAYDTLSKEGVFKNLATGAEDFGHGLQMIFHYLTPILKLMNDLGKDKELMKVLGVGIAGIATAGAAKFALGKIPGVKPGLKWALTKWKSRGGGMTAVSGGSTSAVVEFRTQVTQAGEAFSNSVNAAAARIEEAAGTFSSEVTSGSGVAAEEMASGGEIGGEAVASGAEIGGESLGAGGEAAAVELGEGGSIAATEEAAGGAGAGAGAALGVGADAAAAAGLAARMKGHGHNAVLAAYRRHIKAPFWKGALPTTHKTGFQRLLTDLGGLFGQSKPGTKKLTTKIINEELQKKLKDQMLQLRKQEKQAQAHMKKQFGSMKLSHPATGAAATAAAFAGAAGYGAAGAGATLSALQANTTALTSMRTSLTSSVQGEEKSMAELVQAVRLLTAALSRGSSHGAIAIDHLHMNATDPVTMQRKLIQHARRAAISSRPNGPSLGTMA